MKKSKIRNVAIIAHVDHGKTTLVDQLLKQTGTFRENQQVAIRVMDSMDLERERGITIMAKNGSCRYKDHHINIIDTPGHADFGGEVERVLNMADGALFLVDAAEGPMPQSFFVLKKAIARKLPVIVIVNKIDKPMARCDWVVDQVFDLMVSLNAPDHILDFAVLYACSRDGYASTDMSARSGDMLPVLDLIIERIPSPVGDSAGSLQLLVSTINYSQYSGRLAIGKITSGKLAVNQEVVVATDKGHICSGRIVKLFVYEATKQVEVASASTGEIVAVAGLEQIKVGETITDPANPIPLPWIPVDPPTLSMNFLPNDSHFAGKEGTFVTSRHIRDRLMRETLSDIALHVEDLTSQPGYKVSGRGELHLAILIEKMRREGYEFQVSPPSVIYKKSEEGERLEPYEELTIDVAENLMGKVIENLGTRKGQLLEVHQSDAMVRLKYKIPTRGLLGYQSEFMTDTKGMGILNYVFAEYGPYVGELLLRKNGVIIANQTDVTVAYALDNLQERGVLFLGPAEHFYAGQIVGEHSRENDIVVNPAKSKKLTNMRASGSDDAIILIPPRRMSLEQCISYIMEGELVEITPKSIRLRKLKYNN